jgi:hypothetical protein
MSAMESCHAISSRLAAFAQKRYEKARCSKKDRIAEVCSLSGTGNRDADPFTDRPGIHRLTASLDRSGLTDFDFAQPTMILAHSE